MPDTYPRLHAILDVDAAGRAGYQAVDLARRYFDGGARVLQIRAKHLASGPFLALCDDVVSLAAPYAATVVVNDRVDLARLSGTTGVHVGQDDLTPGAARALLGPSAVVGVSTHSVAQVEAALVEPVDYIAVGPVFETGTKDTGYEAVGLALVTAAARLAGSRPIVAIGGITLERAPDVWRAGAAAVAVVGDLLVGGDPRVRVASYNRVAKNGPGG